MISPLLFSAVKKVKMKDQCNIHEKYFLLQPLSVLFQEFTKAINCSF